MKNKFQLTIILLTIIVLLFPSISFSEMKTVTGEDCRIITGDKKDINWKSERRYIRLFSIENGLKKISRSDIFLSIDFVEDIRNNYLENFKVISHTEKGRKICEKVQFTIDTEVLQKVTNSYENKIRLSFSDCMSGDYYSVNSFLREYVLKENRRISICLIVENKTHNISKVENERLSDEIENTFIKCLDVENDLRKTVKIIERRHLNKILEEHNLSISGITEGNRVKIGKIENLDIIFLRIIYDDRFTTKLLNVETGEVLYVSSRNPKSEKEERENLWGIYE